MRRLSVLCLVLVFIIAGCSRTKPPSSAQFPSSGVVFQIDRECVRRYITKAADCLPSLTIWGDGRVVFAADDGFMREGSIDPGALREFMQSTMVLYDYQESYEEPGLILDGAHITFAVRTEKGRKAVTYVEPGFSSDPNTAHVFQGLESLRQQAERILPKSAPVMAPKTVLIQTHTPPGGPGGLATTDRWPSDLTGRLEGAQATEAVRLAGLGPAKPFLVEDIVYLVIVIPEIERL